MVAYVLSRSDREPHRRDQRGSGKFHHRNVHASFFGMALSGSNRELLASHRWPLTETVSDVQWMLYTVCLFQHVAAFAHHPVG